MKTQRLRTPWTIAVDRAIGIRLTAPKQRGSLFWGSSGMDVAVIRIAGTTEELWETYSPTFDKMGEFELIDMKRFEK